MKEENLRKCYLTYSIPKLKKLADKSISDYIRQRDQGVCYTCRNQKEWKLQQCGHYISRVYTNLRYYEPNLKTQCYSCNVMKYGNMDEFAIRLEAETPGILKHLNDWKRRPSTPLTHKDLIEIIFKYKKLPTVSPLDIPF